MGDKNKLIKIQKDRIHRRNIVNSYYNNYNQESSIKNTKNISKSHNNVTKVIGKWKL